MTKRIRSLIRGAVILVWGCLLSAYLVRGFFMHPEDEIQRSHDGASYVYRVVEFRSALAHGHASPQWAPDFRGGLGSPYFSYYQPAFFYVASAVPASIPPAKMLGVAVWLFALLGYVGMVALVTRFFDRLSGIIAGSVMMFSPYPGTELYERGDLTEFAAMMCLPLLLWAYLTFLDSALRRAWLILVAVGGVLVCSHPGIALPAFGMLTLMSAYFLLGKRTRRNAVGALLAMALGACLAGFYSLPVLLEFDLVGHEAAFTDYYHYGNHFISPWWLLGSYTYPTPIVGGVRMADSIPFTLGAVVVFCVAFNTVWLGCSWPRLGVSQRRMLLVLMALALVSVFLMTPHSRFLWDQIGLLQRLQFPWRLLAIVTVALAGISGPALFFAPRRFRVYSAAVIILATWGPSLQYTAKWPSVQFEVPRTGADLVQAYVAPDLRDEWMPRGASTMVDRVVPTQASSQDGVTVGDCRREFARFTCDVETTTGGSVTLPHYYFPVGWSASLAGEELTLSPDRDGLMTVRLPPASRGVLVVLFRMTPARKLGWLLSLSALVVTALVVLFWRDLFTHPPER